MRDAQRAKVYAAEEFVRTLFDRADGRGSLDFFGTALTLPPEVRFGSVDAVRRYVEDVLALPAVRQRWPAAGTCAVRSRRGVTAAHYEPGMIAVPDGQSRWALRELVVLHELAHHLTDDLAGDGGPHGPGFVGTMTDLAGCVMGPEVQHVLRVIYAKEGVSG